MSLVIASMVRNEAGGYLTSALDAWTDFADEIVVLDDNSTDGTREILDSRGVRVLTRLEEPAWGAESPARQQLWKAAVESGCGWILVLDADMVPAKDPKILTQGGHDAVLFLLYDLWLADPPHYRADRHWQAHNVPRMWLVRNPTKDVGFEWNQRGIHCGHFPRNLPVERRILAPRDFSLLHYGYADPKDRERKYQRYMEQAHQLTLHEKIHADTIVDPYPRLKPLDVDIRWPLVKSES